MWLVSRLRDDTGTALVELALVLPLVLVLLFGMLEFGRAFNYWIDETHLANEGARFASVNKNPGGTTTAEFATFLRNQMTTDELKLGKGSVESVPKVCIRFLRDGAAIDLPQVGDAVEIEIKTSFNWMPLLDAEVGLTTAGLVGKAVMRLEQPPTTYQAGCA